MNANKTKERLTVSVHNYYGSQDDLSARTWAAVVYRADGTLYSAQRVAADFGQTGTLESAREDAQRAVGVLKNRRYDVQAI